MRIREREKMTFGSVLGLIISLAITFLLFFKGLCLAFGTLDHEVPGLVFITGGLLILILSVIFFSYELTHETKEQEEMRKKREEEIRQMKERSRLK